MKFIIDRFEGDIAICEDENMNHTEIEKSILPKGAREGSSIMIDSSGIISLIDDSGRVNRIAEKMRRLYGKDHKGRE